MSKNADKVDTAIDKAGDIVDKKTQGKYASAGRQGAGRRQEGRRRRPIGSRQVPPTQQSGQTPPANDPPTAPPAS